MANYHVNYLTGSDVTGDGSTGSPWASIKHALATPPVVTGDVVKVAGSTFTDIDTAAQPASSNRTNTINTSVDLTSQLAVNDVFRYNPNMSDGPEFNGWMLDQVVAITSTTITTRGYFMFPNQATTNMTITKINDQIISNTAETGINENITGVTIEGGYDATFTSVVGLTFFTNTTSAGSYSGTKFSFNGGSTRDVNTPLFKNFGFARWQRPIEGGFGKYAQVQNLHIITANPVASYQGFKGPNAEAVTNIYMTDCSGFFPSSAADNYGYGGNQDDFKSPIKLFCSENRDRLFDGRSTGVVNGGLLMYSAKQATFGVAQLWSNANNVEIKGDVSIMGIDDAQITSGYARLNGIMQGTGNIYADSINLVRNGNTNEMPLFPINNNKLPMPGYFKLPTGEELNDYSWSATNADYNAPVPVTFEDDNGIWNSFTPGVFIKQNLVDQETGDSCLQIRKTKNVSYGDIAFSPVFMSFNTRSGAQKLTSIQVRYKIVPGTKSSTLFTIGSFQYEDFESIGNQVTLNSTSWATATINVQNSTNTGTGAYVEYFPDMDVNLFARLENTIDTVDVLIDSITPVYS